MHGIITECKANLTRRAGKALSDPGSPAGAIIRPVDLLEVEQPCGLLLEVREHRRQQLPACVRGAADSREGANCLQEVLVSVGGVGIGEQTLETYLTQNRLENSDIVRIAEASWVNVLYCRGWQHAPRDSLLSDNIGNRLLSVQSTW